MKHFKLILKILATGAITSLLSACYGPVVPQRVTFKAVEGRQPNDIQVSLKVPAGDGLDSTAP